MQFMTREIWDALILGAMIVGVALAFVRIYGDMTRPLRRSRRPDAISETRSE